MIEFKNIPNTETPINAGNLNAIQKVQEQSIVISSGTVITNNYEITVPFEYQLNTNELEVYWNGILLKKVKLNEDGHYIEASTTSILIYRTEIDGNYTLPEDVIVTFRKRGA